MILAVDFDLTLCSDSSFGDPMPGAQEMMRRFQTRGISLVVHTCKANTPSGRKAVMGWLLEHDIPFSEIEPKPLADRYIDDKALRFDTWDAAWKELNV